MSQRIALQYTSNLAVKFVYTLAHTCITIIGMVHVHVNDSLVLGLAKASGFGIYMNNLLSNSHLQIMVYVLYIFTCTCTKLELHDYSP